MRAILSCILIGLVAGSVLSADEKVDAKKLVGKWQMEEKGENGPVTIEFEFRANEKMTVTCIYSNCIKISHDDYGYKIEGNKVVLTIGVMGGTTTKTLTVIKLTDTELVTRDEQGKEQTRHRVKAK